MPDSLLVAIMVSLVLGALADPWKAARAVCRWAERMRKHGR